MTANYAEKKQIYKFGLYGLLKNLKFFEPYLWIYFLLSGLSLFEIGILYSIREVIIYVFEIPSGVIADRFGKKNELIACFIFYIISFIVFFFAGNFYVFIIAMIFFGFGEAFRSGTHKAMIMEFLDVNGVTDSKSRVYGLTRSYSNIGSAISSLVGIILVLYSPKISYLFLVAIIPYIGDLLLIMTYPEYLNKREDTTFSFKEFMKQNISSVKYAFTTKKLNRYIIESSAFNAIFKTIKDYIQPIILSIGLATLLFTQFNEDENIKIYIGLIYFISQFISVFVAKNAYRLEKMIGSNKILTIIWMLTSFTVIVLGIYIENIFVVIISFALFYTFLNIRKPFMIEKIGDLSISNKRASVLSIESQITSLFIIVLAPLLGFISDQFNIGIMMISLGIFMIVVMIINQKEKSAKD